MAVMAIHILAKVAVSEQVGKPTPGVMNDSPEPYS